MSFINKWKDKIAHYIEVRINLFKLGLIERISNILSYLIFVFIGLFLSVSMLIFVGIGIGEYFSSLLDSRAGGFFITAGFYVLLLVILFVLRAPITNGFTSVFIRIMTATEAENADQKAEAKTRDDIKVD
ncbi:MAG TPA: hypothetical protein PL009_07405 [Flavipsychrobacter sp.]|nr:hypothetical protein [Flavipsychrobacter sp.]